MLFGLGIRYVGETVADKLAAHYRTIDALAAASATELAAVPEVGGVIAESAAAWFQDDFNRQIVARLQAAGVQMAADRRSATGRQRPTSRPDLRAIRSV